MAKNTVHNELRLDEKSIRRLDRVLSQIAIELRARELEKATRKGGNVIARAMRRKAPKPGYPGDKPDLKPLKNTIGVVIRRYGRRFVRLVAMIGPQYPAGAHGHLVEFGHEEVLFGERTGRRVPPHPFARPAFDESRQKAMNEIIRALIRFIRKQRK